MPGCSRRDLYSDGSEQHFDSVCGISIIGRSYKPGQRINELERRVLWNGDDHSDINRALRNDKCRQSGDSQSNDRANELYKRSYYDMPGCGKWDLYGNGGKQYFNSIHSIASGGRINKWHDRCHGLGCIVLWNSNYHSHINWFMRDNNSRQGSDSKSDNRTDDLYSRLNNDMPGCS